MKYIKTTIENQIGVITLNNDRKRNSLSYETLNELIHAFEQFSESDVITELPTPGNDPVGYSHPLEQLFRAIETIKVPVIAMITGSVWGGAFELAVTCDIIIGTPNCSFAITPAKIGVAYNASGLLHFLDVVEMHIVKELFFTAQPIKAPRAYNLGILNNLVDADKIESFTYEMAINITKNSPLSIGVNELRSNSYNSYDYLEGKNSFLQKREPVFKGK